MRALPAWARGNLTLWWDVSGGQDGKVRSRARTEVVVVIAQKYAFVGVRPELLHQVPRRLVLPARRWVDVGLTCSVRRPLRFQTVQRLSILVCALTGSQIL